MANDSSEIGSPEPVVLSDTGPFAIVPEWVLDAKVSDRAVRLYAVLGRYADTAGTAYPSRRLLADRLRCSVDTVDRAVKELVAAEALDVDARYDDEGDQTSNLYTVRRVRPGGSTAAAPRGHTDAATGGLAAAAQNESQVEREPTERKTLTVNRKRATDVELERAHEILGEWNRQTGQTLRSKEWLAKIILRIREYPELGLVEHEHIIRVSLQRAWWRGAPSPSVIYGNGAQFERQLMEATRTAPSETQAAFEVAMRALNERSTG